MTKVKKDREEQGKITIEEWYEVTGSINVPEGGKSFWVLSKGISENEPYNFFMRIDRNIKAEDHEDAQTKVSEWAREMLLTPIEKEFNIEEMKVNSPTEFSVIAKTLRDS